MTRIFGHYVSGEMIALALSELLLSFVIIYVVLTAPAIGGLGASTSLPATLSVAAVLALAIGATAVIIGLYRPGLWLDTGNLLRSMAAAAAIAFPAVLAVSTVFGVRLATLPFAELLRLVELELAWGFSILVTRLSFRLAMRRNLFARRVLILGDGAAAADLAALLHTHRRGFVEVAGTVEAADAALSPAQLRRQRVSTVIIATATRDAAVFSALLACKCGGIRVLDAVAFREQQLRKIDLGRIDAGWLVAADGLRVGRLQGALRRGGDLGFALLVLLFTLPVMLLAAVLIKLDSRGPVLYRQVRIGEHGAPFTLLKFRSMRVDAEAAAGPQWATLRDPRVTRIGGVLRSTRIDELPQILNVLRGEMSFIGPRPERPHFVGQLAEVIPFYRDRAAVKPGITGWAQVNYPYGASIEDAREKLSYDLYYVKNRSLFLDVLILFATVRVILFREGAR